MSSQLTSHVTSLDAVLEGEGVLNREMEAQRS